MKTIILTGGIGSGKSLVSSFFRENGIPVYDCDSMVKELYESHPELKAMVSEDIFSSPGKLNELEKHLFPVVSDDFGKWSKAQDTEFVAMESATILDKEYFNGFGDIVIYVTADEDIRIRRVKERSGLDENAIRERMALQGNHLDDPRVTYIIENNASVEECRKQVNNLTKKIKNGTGKN